MPTDDPGLREVIDWCEESGGDVEWDREDQVGCYVGDEHVRVRHHRDQYQVTINQEGPGINVVQSDPRGTAFMLFENVRHMDREGARGLLKESAGEDIVDIYTDEDVLVFEDDLERLAVEIG